MKYLVLLLTLLTFTACSDEQTLKELTYGEWEVIEAPYDHLIGKTFDSNKERFLLEDVFYTCCGWHLVEWHDGYMYAIYINQLDMEEKHSGVGFRYDEETKLLYMKITWVGGDGYVLRRK